MAPVGIASMIPYLASPRRITDPFPKSFSIFSRVKFKAFNLSSFSSGFDSAFSRPFSFVSSFVIVLVAIFSLLHFSSLLVYTLKLKNLMEYSVLQPAQFLIVLQDYLLL